MGSGYKRADLQAIAQAKLDDALNLLKNGRFSNAYYLSGYAVEIGLKACVAAQISADTIPDPDLMKNVLNHDFKKLVGLAGLQTELRLAESSDPRFHAYWGIVSDWSPESRYENCDPMTAQLMVEAVGNSTSGVLKWIKKFW